MNNAPSAVNIAPREVAGPGSFLLTKHYKDKYEHDGD